VTSRAKILLMAFVGAAVSLGTLVAQAQKKPGIAYPAYPNDPRRWRHVKSAVVFSKESKLYDRFAGLHNVYVNDIAWPAMKNRKPYPDGSMLALELYDISTRQGMVEPRARKAVFLMKKNAKLYADTGGWGFQMYPETPAAGYMKDMKECFSCHQKQKDTDYILSTYME